MIVAVSTRFRVVEHLQTVTGFFCIAYRLLAETRPTTVIFLIYLQGVRAILRRSQSGHILFASLHVALVSTVAHVVHQFACALAFNGTRRRVNKRIFVYSQQFVRHYLTAFINQAAVVLARTFFKARTRIIRIIGVLIVKVHTVQSVDIHISLQLFGKISGSSLRQITHTGFVVVTQDSHIDLDTLCLQRTDELIGILQQERHLVVAEYMNASRFIIHIDVGSKDADYIEERLLAVLHGIFTHVQDVFIVHFHKAKSADISLFRVGNSCQRRHQIDISLIVGRNGHRVCCTY